MRSILLILTLTGLTAASGCRMCAHPYDECGPTFMGECGPVVCNPYARAGSVLSPPLMAMAAPCETPMVEGSAPTEGENTLEPIPSGEPVMTAPELETTRVVPAPRSARNPRRSGPTFLR